MAFILFILKKFMAKYNINSLSNKITVRRNRVDTDVFHFQLDYFSWVYPKKDGTADKRRSWNRIQWGKSTFYLPDYLILSSRPFELTRLVKMLRQNGYDIKEKSLQASNLNLDKIIELFEDR